MPPLFILLICFAFYYLGHFQGLLILLLTMVLFGLDVFMGISSRFSVEWSRLNLNPEILFLLSFIISLIIILYVFMTLQKNQERLTRQAEEHSKLLEKQKQELEVLVREVHHRIKNNLSMVKGMVYLHKQQLTEERSRQIMDDLSAKIDSIILTHQHLYRGSRNEKINCSQYIQQLTRGIMELNPQKDIKIKLEISAEIPPLNGKTIIPIGLIIAEALTNAFKYAFPKNSGTVCIRFYQAREEFFLIIEDNGVGLGHTVASKIDKKESLGINIMQRLASQLGGEITFENSQGTRIKLVLPGQALTQV